MEMAICKLYQQAALGQIPKILYIAPIKQLVTEKRLEWERYRKAKPNAMTNYHASLQLFCLSWIESDGTDWRYINR
jgi:hypothetical protein